MCITFLGFIPSGDSEGGPGGGYGPPRFLVGPPACPPSFFLNFTFKFAWLTHTADNFRPAIFYVYVGPPTFSLGPAVPPHTFFILESPLFIPRLGIRFCAPWPMHHSVIYTFKAVVLKPWPADHMWPAWLSGVAREAICVGKKT